MPLTDKQVRFCQEYLISFNRMQACIASGFQLQFTPCNKYFVYLLVDPRNEQIFYIGKGTKKRPYNHIKEAKTSKPSNQFKFNRIVEILAVGYEVDIYYFAKDLEESQAYKIETELIKTIGTKNLTNISGGVNKQSIKEWAKYNLSTMLPFNQWVKLRGIAFEFEKSLYWQCKKAYEEISENGYIYSVEQRIINGKLETIEKRRM